LILLVAAAALGDYRESYGKGIRAIDNSDWSGAIEALRAAAAEKSKEGERVLVYGMRFKPYLPHYYLGLAYFNTGNCQAALRAWAESERQGAVRETAEYRTLGALREQCRERGARGLEKQTGEKQTGEKRQVDGQAEKEARDPLVAQKIRTALADISLKVRDARRLLRDSERRRLPDAVSKGKTELEALVGEAQRTGPGTPLPELERLRGRLGVSVAALRVSLRRIPVVSPPAPESRPPAVLLEAATAYFQGDYEGAARALEGVEFADPRAGAQTRLLRSAARYGTFVTGGERDEALQTRAVEDIHECLRLEPKLEVSTRFFSPRFVEFFKKNSSQTRD
jgi:tetratricopeptide (TPR) repeat protein